jgi:ribonuclease HI
VAGTIYLYTDTSIRGDRYLAGEKYRRRMRGPATVAWCAWHDAPTTGRPTFAGQATVGGERGPQAGEYKAVLHGLAAALIYVRTTPQAQPEALVLHTDNKLVHGQLALGWSVSEMTRYYKAACGMLEAPTAEGIRCSVVKVTDRDLAFRIAHSLSKRAWEGILYVEAWRPHKHPPPAPKPPPQPQ